MIDIYLLKILKPIIHIYLKIKYIYVTIRHHYDALDFIKRDDCRLKFHLVEYLDQVRQSILQAHLEFFYGQ